MSVSRFGESLTASATGAGQVTDLEIAAREILRIRDLLEEILEKHTDQTRERIHLDTDRDFVMEVNDAIETFLKRVLSR